MRLKNNHISMERGRRLGKGFIAFSAIIVVFSIILSIAVFSLQSGKSKLSAEAAVSVSNFSYTGGVQSFTAPSTGTFTIELWGAQGGLATYTASVGPISGGKGGYTKAEVFLKKGTVLFVYVGEQGCTNTVSKAVRYNGGGATTEASDSTPWGASGGGATDIRTVNASWNDATGLTSRLMVAGGGGGSNARGDGYGCGDGGAGGGIVGGSGTAYNNDNTWYGGNYSTGSGGTQYSGGTRYSYNYSRTLVSTDSSGSFGMGGAEQSGGGGGWYGGAATGHGGAGGGSSYVNGYVDCSPAYCNPAYTFTDAVMQQGVREGNGYATITGPISDDKSYFDYTGGVQTFTPSVSGVYSFELWGAQGGTASAYPDLGQSYRGGTGGYTRASFFISSGTTVYLYVGGMGGSSVSGFAAGGYNGGGSSQDSIWATGGGGATDIRIGGTDYLNRIAVAGGGGAGNNRGSPASDGTYYGSGIGGDGGGLVGGTGSMLGYRHDGSPNYTTHGNGSGGGQTSGGYETVYYSHSDAVVSSGTYQGSFGYAWSNSAVQSGGGGGWYGGGGCGHGGAGGGSSYINGYSGCDTTYYNSSYPCLSGEVLQGGNYGNGYAKVSLVRTVNSSSKILGYTGAVQTYSVPTSGYYQIELFGAQGGTAHTYANNPIFYGGKGGYTSGKVWLKAGTSINVYVGGKGGSTNGILALGGFNGGATADNVYYATGGGGATDIRIGGTDYTNRILVAGGGGAGNNRGVPADDGVFYGSGTGGAGGGLIGGTGSSVWHYIQGMNNHDQYSIGTGGTQTEGGFGIRYYSATEIEKERGGYPGSFGCASSSSGIQSGGGGGWYGGGSSDHGGAGGGSSYINGYQGCSTTYYNSSYHFYDGVLTQGVMVNDGMAIFTLLLQDTTAPSSATLTPDRSLSYYYNSVEIAFSGSSDSGAGFSHYEYSIDGGSFTVGDKATVSSSLSSGTETKTLTVRAYDNLDNYSTATRQITFDRTNYSVSYVLGANGTNGSGNPSSYNVESASYTLSSPSRTGYSFNEWYSDSSYTTLVTGIPTQSRGNKTFYAKWTAKQYTVTLNNQHATSGGSASVIVTFEQPMPSATMPTRTGYTFGGYFSETNGNGTQYYAVNGSSANNWTTAGGGELFAKWTITEFEVSLSGTLNVNYNPSGNSTALSTAISPKYDTVFDYSYSWQKYINSVWTDIGKTTKNLDIKAVAESGAYKVIATATDRTYGGSLSCPSDSVIVTVNKIATVIDMTNVNKDYVYSGSLQTVEIGAVLNHEETTPAYTDNTFTDRPLSGQQTVTVYSVETANYLAKTTSFEIFIAAKSLNTDASISAISSVTYKGSEHRPTVEVIDAVCGTLIFDTDYTCAYTNNINKGTATVTVSGKGNYSGDMSKDFTIVEKNLTGNVGFSAVSAVTYNKGEHKPKPTVTDISQSKALVEGTDFSYAYSANTNAGTATITVTGLGNYKASESMTFTINKAVATINVENVVRSYTYTGGIQTVSGGATLNHTECGLIYSNNTFTTVAEGNGKVITILAAETDNYLSAHANVSIAVERAVATINTDAIENGVYTYTGSLQTITGAVLNHNEVELSYSGNFFIDVPTGGTMNIAIAAVQSPNYKPVSKNVIVTINKADTIIDTSAMTQEYTYTGREQTVLGLARCNYENALFNYSNNTFTNVPSSGYLEVKVSTNETKNYKPGLAFAQIKINKAETNIDVSGVTKNYTYNASLQTVNSGAEMNHSETALVYTNNTFTDRPENENGEKEITISSAETGNYKSKMVTVTITVARAVAVITIDEEEKIYTYMQDREYNPVEQVVTVGASLNHNETALLYSNNTFTIRPISGKHTVTVSAQETKNFLAVNGTFEITINRATASIDTDTIEGASYEFTGEEQVIDSGAILNHRETELVYSNNTFTDVPENGILTITVSAAETENFLAVTTDVEVNVNRKTATIDTTAMSENVYTYTGREQVIASGAVLNHTETELVYSRNTFVNVPETGILTVHISAAQTRNFTGIETDVDISINRATSIITLAEGFKTAFVYTGEVQTINSGATLNHTETTLSYENNSFTTVREGNGKKVRIIATETGNYTSALKEVTITVTKALQTIDVTNVRKEYTYTGNQITVTGGAVIEDDEQTIVFTNNVFRTVSEGDGREVVISVAESDNYFAASVKVKLVVHRAETRIDTSGVERFFEYDGEAHVINSGAAFLTNADGRTIQYTNNEFTDVPESGKLTVIISAEQSANYTVAREEVEVTISKLQPYIDISGVIREYTYNGRLQTVNSGATLRHGENLLDYPLVYSDNTFQNVPQGGKQMVTISLGESKNYKSATAKVEITILKAATTINTINFKTKYTYDGESHTINSGVTLNHAETTIVFGNNTFCDVPETGSAESTFGELYVTILAVETQNYLAFSDTRTIKISKAQPIIDTTDVIKSYTFSGLEQTVNSGAKLLFGDNILEYPLSYSNNTFTSVPEGGRQTVTISSSGTQNYLPTSKTLVIYIAKKSSEINTDNIVKTYTYDGLEHRIEEGALLNHSEAVLAYSNNVFTDRPSEGILTLTVAVSETENYTAASESVLISVGKKPLTIIIDDKEITYGNAQATLTYGLKDGFNLAAGDVIDDLRVELTIGEDAIYAGEHQINGSYLNDNYEVTFKNADESSNYAKYTIQRRALTIAIDDKTSEQLASLSPLTYSVTNGEIVTGDELNVVLTKADGTAVGEYRISGSYDNDNYYVTFTNATNTQDYAIYVITERTIYVTINDKFSYYGDALLPLSYTFRAGDEGLRDVLGITLTKEEGTVAGEYIISATNGNPEAKVSFLNDENSEEPAKYTIARRPIEITLEKQSSVYKKEIAVSQTAYKLTKGSVLEQEPLSIEINKEEGDGIGVYELSAIVTITNGDMDNYSIMVVHSEYSVTKIPTKITTSETSIVKPYSEKGYSIEASLTGDGVLVYSVQGKVTENKFIESGIYVIEISATETAEYLAPSPVTVTLAIKVSELKAVAANNEVRAEVTRDEGFLPDTEIIFREEAGEYDNLSEYVGNGTKIAKVYEVSVNNDGTFTETTDGKVTVHYELPAEMREKTKIKVLVEGEDGVYHTQNVTVNEGSIEFEMPASSCFAILAEDELRFYVIIILGAFVVITILLILQFMMKN